MWFFMPAGITYNLYYSTIISYYQYFLVQFS
nr:MAG TPA: hypothetical protein [Caudoviricetes sp.]